MRPHYLIIFTAVLGCCFGVQWLCLRAAGGRTVKSESNFFSSIGRIQAGARGEPQAMVLGSSITGRLPDRAQGFEGWANMGCDGGTAVDALRAMDEGVLPRAPLLVVEANTLHLALRQGEGEIARAMRGVWFDVGVRIPLLAAYARPAAFLYSPLLARKTGAIDEPAALGGLGVSGAPPAVPGAQEVEWTPESRALVDELTSILRRLQSRGSEVVVVWMPPGRRSGSPPPPWIVEFCHRAGVRHWDLGQEVPAGTVRLTDGIHMDASSAARTMNTLTEVLGPR